MSDSRVCPLCKESKALAAFSPRGGARRHTYCRPCNAQYQHGFRLASRLPAPVRNAKRCSSCKRALPLEDFARTARGALGRQSYCRMCHGRSSFATAIRKYGLIPEDWARMFHAQSGRCAACRAPVSNPDVDHCHRTGAVRGLLCPGCNKALGCVRDSTLALQALGAYLARTNSEMP